MSSPARLITAEQLLDSPDPRHRELVGGVPRVSEPPGGVHGRLALKLGSRLDEDVTRLGFGTVLVEAGYLLEKGDDTVRGPDVSFMSAARVPPARIPEEFISGRRISRSRSSPPETAGPRSSRRWRTTSPPAREGSGWWIRGNDG